MEVEHHYCGRIVLEDLITYKNEVGDKAYGKRSPVITARAFVHSCSQATICCSKVLITNR